MVRHEVDEGIIGFRASQTKVFERPVALTENRFRAYAERIEHGADLTGVERIFPVLAVPVRNTPFLQQGDRPATGVSGACANQLEHVPSRDDTIFTIQAAAGPVFTTTRVRLPRFSDSWRTRSCSRPSHMQKSSI